MTKILLIAKREYNAAVKSKAFLISLIAMPVFMFGGLIVQLISKKMEAGEEKKIAVIDRTQGQAVLAVFQGMVDKRNKEETVNPKTGERTASPVILDPVLPSANTEEAMQKQRNELCDRIRKGELEGIVEIGAEILDPPAQPVRYSERYSLPDSRIVRYQSRNAEFDRFPRWCEPVINQIVFRLRCQKLGLPIDKVASSLTPVHVLPKKITSADSAQEKGKDEKPSDFQFLVAIAAMFLMFMVIYIGALPLMQGVVEEKIQRIAEVLLGSVTPFELMLGKLIGQTGVSLTLAAVYLIGGVLAANHYGYVEFVPARLIAWFVVFLGVGTFLYGAMFISIGAAASDMKETQTLMTPVTLLMVLPMMFMWSMIRNPNGPMAVFLTLFPPSASMAVAVREAVSPDVPAWQPVLALFLTVLATLFCVFAAGRIFRIGFLMQGKGASFRDMARWVLSG